ncbi:MAG: hypothetical protein ACRCZE_02910 [Candidatus Altimarinota bacterium]
MSNIKDTNQSDPAIDVNGKDIKDFQAERAAKQEVPGEAPVIELNLEAPKKSLEAEKIVAEVKEIAKNVCADDLAVLCETNNFVGGVAKCDDKIVSENVDEFNDEYFERAELAGALDQLNNLAILEIDQLKEDKKYNDRLAKSKSFRKRVWETITSPWETTKKIGRGIKSAFNYLERTNPSVAKYQDQVAKFGKQREAIYKDYEDYKLEFESPANVEYQFIKEKGRLAKDVAELLSFRGGKISDEFKKYTTNYNNSVLEENGADQASILKGIVDESSYLRFKQSPRNWYNQSWLGNRKPVVKTVGEFLRVPGTWRNFKAFFSSNNPTYPDVYPGNAVKKAAPVAYAPVAAYYAQAEENTNSGVFREVPVMKKVQKKKQGGFGMKLAAAAIGVAAFLGLYEVNKRNQKVESDTNHTSAAMVANNNGENAEKAKGVEITESKDNLEDIAEEKPVIKDTSKKPAAKPVAINYRKTAQAKSVQIISPIDKAPKLTEKPVDEAAKELVALNEKLRAELKNYKDSLAMRLVNLKAKIKNPGYLAVSLPEGNEAWGNLITSSNIASVPDSESYENHIDLVEAALAKNEATQADLTAADAALSKSEDRMANNIKAENEARLRNAFNLFVVSANAKLKNYRQAAVQQLLNGTTESENLYRVKVSGKKEYYFVDLNKVAEEIKNLPVNFSSEGQGIRTIEYAKWYVNSGMLRQSK